MNYIRKIYVCNIKLKNRPNRDRSFTFEGCLYGVREEDLYNLIREKIADKYNCELSDIQSFNWEG